jgi:Replication initiator protein A
MTGSSVQNALFKANQRRHILRVEKNLSTIGVFTPRLTRPKEVSKVIRTMTRLPDGAQVEAQATINSHPKFGLPITADQDKFYALTRILDDVRQKTGSIQNPITFNYSQILKLLGRKKNGDAHREIDEWLMRMKHTVIMSEGVVWLSGRKRYSTDAFNVFDRVIGMGEELDNGEKAGSIHVFLSSWLLENFENNYVLPIDYELYRELRFPIAKALVPLLQVWFYASRHSKKSTVEKRYPELCELLGIERARKLSRIYQTTENSLEELKYHKLIRHWDFQPTADGKHYKLIVAPGDRFVTERQAKLAWASSSPEQQEFEELLVELTKRGVHEEISRELLYNARDLRAVRLRIEYVDSEVRRRSHTRSPIKNPPGLFRYFIENEAPVPESFAPATESTTKAGGDVRTAYLNYRYWEAEKYFKSQFTSEQRQERLDEAKFRLRQGGDEWSYLPAPTIDAMVYNDAIQQVESEVELLSFEQFSRLEQSQLSLNLS